jgi:hypothetical protein
MLLARHLQLGVRQGNLVVRLVVDDTLESWIADGRQATTELRLGLLHGQYPATVSHEWILKKLIV